MLSGVRDRTGRGEALSEVRDEDRARGGTERGVFSEEGQWTSVLMQIFRASFRERLGRCGSSL